MPMIYFMSNMSEHTYNFSAGPGTLPEEVLVEAGDGLLCWRDTGFGVAEMSHRSAAFEEIIGTAERDLRDLMAIPPNYRVLFLQGGATGQFAAVPMNLAGENMTADYVVTGMWGAKAAKEGANFLSSAHIAAEADPYTHVPPTWNWQLTEGAPYVHVTTNETINGVRMPLIPELGVPLVADRSSDILSEPIDVSEFGVIYAGAQKNIGPAGLTVVIVNDELLDRREADVPTVWDWKAQAKANSMLNTPPTVPIYMAGLVFKWLNRQGGVGTIADINAQKAELLYGAIDSSDLFCSPVQPEFRSRMNVPFALGQVGSDAVRRAELETAFLEQAEQEGLVELKGHRNVGGFRASLYNAMPLAGVVALVEFMQDFENRH